MIGKHGCFVGANPSRLRTSLNSGFVTIVAMALLVSIALPPPTVTIASAPAALQAATPDVTFSMVGFGLILSYTS